MHNGDKAVAFAPGRLPDHAHEQPADSRAIGRYNGGAQSQLQLVDQFSSNGLPMLSNTAGASAGLENGQKIGNVYLDGRLLGRWVTAQLDKIADRSPNGSSTFNIRQSLPPAGLNIGLY